MFLRRFSADVLRQEVLLEVKDVTILRLHALDSGNRNRGNRNPASFTHAPNLHEAELHQAELHQAELHQASTPRLDL
ncbi:hypothetical protein OAK37_00085 [bacterium]|nr:hypothetical protein [bacterium]